MHELLLENKFHYFSDRERRRREMITKNFLMSEPSLSQLHHYI